MIKTEFYRVREDGTNLIRTASTAGCMVRKDQTGELYEEAIDIEGIGYTYTETDIPIGSEELTDSQALDIIMGRYAYGQDDGDEIPAED